MPNWRVSRDAVLVFSKCDILWLLFPKSASDELVYDSCSKTSWCAIATTYCGLIFERITDTLLCVACSVKILNVELLNIMRYLKLLKKIRCVMIRVYSFVVVTLRNDSYSRVRRSFLNVNE